MDAASFSANACDITVPVFVQSEFATVQRDVPYFVTADCLI